LNYETSRDTPGKSLDYNISNILNQNPANLTSTSYWSATPRNHIIGSTNE